VLDSPDWMATTSGALWVKLDPGTVVQLDPATARVRKRVAAHGPDAFNLCQGFGETGDAVWSCTPFGTLERIDAASGRVTDLLRYPVRSDQGHLVEAGNKLWVIPRSGDAIAGIDLSDRTLGQPIGLRASCVELAAADPVVWAVCTADNQVVRVDTAAGRVTGRLAIPQPRQVAVGAGSVWIGFQGGVAQVDPESLAVEAVYDVDAGLAGALWVGRRLVWVRGDQGTFLTALDPVAHRVVYRITAADLPSGGNVIGVGHQLWATAFDDATVVRLRLPTS